LGWICGVAMLACGFRAFSVLSAKQKGNNNFKLTINHLAGLLSFNFAKTSKDVWNSLTNNSFFVEKQSGNRSSFPYQGISLSPTHINLNQQD
jgi:hypothetical protein